MISISRGIFGLDTIENAHLPQESNSTGNDEPQNVDSLSFDVFYSFHFKYDSRTCMIICLAYITTRKGREHLMESIVGMMT